MKVPQEGEAANRLVPKAKGTVLRAGQVDIEGSGAGGGEVEDETEEEVEEQNLQAWEWKAAVQEGREVIPMDDGVQKPLGVRARARTGW